MFVLLSSQASWTSLPDDIKSSTSVDAILFEPSLTYSDFGVHNIVSIPCLVRSRLVYKCQSFLFILVQLAWK